MQRSHATTVVYDGRGYHRCSQGLTGRSESLRRWGFEAGERRSTDRPANDKE